MLSDKRLKALSDKLLPAHLALSMTIITLRQLLVFVNMGWDCRLSSQSRVTYKSPDISGEAKVQASQGKALANPVRWGVRISGHAGER